MHNEETLHFLIDSHYLFLRVEMTSKQVQDDNEAMSNTMYKLLKKYQAIRSIIKTLHVSSPGFIYYLPVSSQFHTKPIKRGIINLRLSHFRVIMMPASFTPYFLATTCSRTWSKMWPTTQIIWNTDMNLESSRNKCLQVFFSFVWSLWNVSI